jgi:arsenite methyltransferase
MKADKRDMILEAVRRHYAKSAERKISNCDCLPTPSCSENEMTSKARMKLYERFSYSIKDVIDFYGEGNCGLCCGNPLIAAELKAGETVLDLGCGGGFDCFLAAKQVGENGHVIGVDMTPKMINLARKNLAEWGFQNVEFRLGEIEHLPVENKSIDVIISNCVINLSPDKASVFREAFRVLKPGGRLAISDIIATSDLPDEIKNDIELLCNCIAGTVTSVELEEMLKSAGFQNIRIQSIRESRESIREWITIKKAADFVISGTVKATKP